jgi:hypothetical protein
MARFVRTQTVRHPIGPTGSFRLSVVDGDVAMRGSDEDEAAVTASFTIRAGSDQEADRIFEAARFIVREGDGSLELEERTGRRGLSELVGRLFGDPGLDASIDVRAIVPRGAAVRVSGVSADVQAEGLSGSQAYRTVSGDLLLSGVGGEVSVEGVSADLTVRAAGALRFESHSVSGDLDLAAPVIESLRAVSVSGNIEIEGQLAPESHKAETVSGDLTLAPLGGVTVEVRGMSSDVSSELDHRLEGSFGRRRLVVGDGAAQLQFSTMSGDVSVVRPRRLGPDLAHQAAGASHDRTATEPETGPEQTGATDAAAGEAAQASTLPDSRLDILRALERGELDVEEAMRRLQEAGDD